MIRPVAHKARRPLRVALLASVAPLAVSLASCKAGDGAGVACRVTHVAVTAASSTMRVGDAVTLHASATAQGCSAAELAPAWSSQDGTIASVNASGVVTALAAGSTSIVASIRGVQALAQVTVMAPVASVRATPASASLVTGESLQLSATPLDAQGGALAGRTVSWQSGDASIATVSASGLVTAITPGGPVTVTASSEGRSAAVAITVTPPPRIALSATAVDFTATAGQANPAAQSVVITNAGGGTLANLVAGPVTYGAGASGWLQLSLPGAAAAPLALLSLQPVITALAAGRYTATVPVAAPGASNSPQQVSVSLTIQATTVRSVTVSPAPFLLAVGGKQQMSATLRDAAGAVVTGRAVSWSSSNPAVAAVDAATGLVTAASTGVASISATVDGVSGAAFAYTGTASAYDGAWRGSAGSGRTITFTVSLGRIASLALNVGTPPGSPCSLTYTAAPLTLIAGNAFSFTTSGGTASGTISGSFLSAASAQGSYGTITFDDYLCPPTLLVSGQVAGATWTASRQ
ncbi:MAG: Ig-like domain-containing protein [Gemmatimonadaceae bacterium]|nr:Ig-like domain-containing protein [Gemmatimonadaceae bacterium]